MITRFKSVKVWMYQMVHSVWFTFGMALFLIGYSLYEIYEDFWALTHEHLLIALGIVMILNCFRHLYEGVHTLFQKTKNQETQAIFKRVDSILDRPISGILIGLIILITSVLALITDIEKLESKSFSFGIGILMVIINLIKSKGGVQKINSGVQALDEEDKD